MTTQFHSTMYTHTPILSLCFSLPPCLLPYATLPPSASSSTKRRCVAVAGTSSGLQARHLVFFQVPPRHPLLDHTQNHLLSSVLLAACLLSLSLYLSPQPSLVFNASSLPPCLYFLTIPVSITAEKRV